MSDLLKLPGLNWPCLHYASLGSTNDEAMRLVLSKEYKRALVWADQQTAGRGQRGRSFFSPAGSGLYLSFIWHDSQLLPGWEAATLRAGYLLATEIDNWLIKEGIESYAGIKWVNDVILNGRKVAGILWEHYHKHHILGLGINLFPAEWPDPISETAGSVFPKDTELDMKVLVAGLWQKLDQGLFHSDWSLDEDDSNKRLLPGAKK